MEELILWAHLKDVPEAAPRSSLKETNRMKYLVQDQRLRIRLGLQPHQKLISGESLHAAVLALGLSLGSGVPYLNANSWTCSLNEPLRSMSLYFVWLLQSPGQATVWRT